MTTNPSTSDGQIKLAIDLLASAMSGSIPPSNWWGYGMPPELTLKTPGISQTTDVRGKAGIGTSKYADESESPVYYNHYCKALHWEFSSSNASDA